MSVFVHDPDAVLDYTWDWGTNFLTDGDTIESASFIVPDSLTIASQSVEGTGDVTATISTDGTLGTRTATCRVVTTNGLTADWTITIYVAQR